MSAFCAEQGIWRKTFYERRARARSEGPAAALEPRSTRPASSPTRIGQEMVLRALAVRSALESSGLDHGPISVHDKMRSMGLEAPSPASPARILAPQGRGPQRAPQAPPLGLAPVRLSGPQRLLAAGRHRVRPGRRAQGRHLPAAGRPLPPGGRLPGCSGGDQRRRDRRVRQGRRRPRRAAKAPDRQRRSPQPQPTGTRRTPGGARASPRGRAHHRQTPQTHHPRATTSASTRLCSATSTSSPRPSPSPTSRPRSTPSTASTTPGAPTRARPGASPASRRGTPPPSPTRPDPTECTTSPPSRPANRRPAPEPRGAVNDEAGSGPTAPSLQDPSPSSCPGRTPDATSRSPGTPTRSSSPPPTARYWSSTPGPRPASPTSPPTAPTPPTPEADADARRPDCHRCPDTEPSPMS